ncbi:MAG TPA: hypothetical protein VF883_20320 [Thermoanaerobaculia bacterium]
MINARDHYVAWAGLVTELDEARDHLEQLINHMTRDGAIDEDDFAVELGHVYAHLNRAWHSRNQSDEIRDDLWEAFSQFPKDLLPVG